MRGPRRRRSAHQLDGNRISLNIEGNEELDFHLTRVYHPVELKKEMGSRYVDNKERKELDFAYGLRSIPDDSDFEPSSFTRLRVEDPALTKCEVLIVVCMYNEGVEHFLNTMTGITKNLETFNNYGVGPHKIACCIIVDGMKPFMQTYNETRGSNGRGFFEQFVDINQINEQFEVNDPMKCKLPDEEEHQEIGHMFVQNVYMEAELPLQLFFLVKQKNKRKLNSHLWFFGGLCEEIQPRFVVLLDIGTRPLEGSLFYMYEAMVIDDQLAGCCGEIKPLNFDCWKLVVPAQSVEYKFSHIFDKALESVLGYITVLPGAFSAYRWDALQGDPLWVDYFRSICHPEEMGPFNSNIYLAEDRVLCLALVSKKECAYTLRYVRRSIAETDVPETIADLMAQRRRWINGSWFALIDSLRNFRKIYDSKHNCCRKSVFTLQMLYYYFTVIFAWFMVGSFFLVFAIAVRTEFPYDDANAAHFGNYIVLLYVILLMIVFILSLAVKPRRINDLYKGIAFVFGMYMLFSIYLVVKLVMFTDDIPVLSRIIISSTFAFFGLNILVNCDLISTLRGIIHFVFLTPTYVNIFLIYSICNIHDCTWGNRPDQMNEDEKRKVEDFEEFRARWCLVWVISNASFGYLLNTMDKDNGDFEYLMIISLMAALILVLRTFYGILYVFIETCCKKRMKKVRGNDRTQVESPDSVHVEVKDEE